MLISRVSDQNGAFLLYIMLEMHHSGREPLIFNVKLLDSHGGPGPSKTD